VTEAKVSLTLKDGPGYDAPMLTIRGDSDQEFDDRFWRYANDPRFTAFFARLHLEAELGARVVEQTHVSVPHESENPSQSAPVSSKLARAVAKKSEDSYETVSS
jgi:hypothetical protein